MGYSPNQAISFIPKCPSGSRSFCSHMLSKYRNRTLDSSSVILGGNRSLFVYCQPTYVSRADATQHALQPRYGGVFL
jgi:hypothetical protein